MTVLAAELAKLRDIVATLPSRTVLATNQMRPTRRVLERILKALDVVAKLPEARLEQVRREIIAAQRSGTDLSKLPSRLLRDAVWLLWPNMADGIDRVSLRRAVLSNIGTSNSTLRRVIDVWLLQFASDDDSFVDAGRQIDRHLAAEQRGILGFWKESHRAYDVFNAIRGPDQLAYRLLGEGSPNLLAACRLDNPARATGGYLRAVHFALSKRLPRRLGEADRSDVLKRATEFYAPRGSLRFDEKEANGVMADAMVSPWVGNGRQPSDRLRLEVLTYLRHHLGDPRVDSRRRWAGASDVTRRTIRAWLSKLSLDAFFNVVGQFAENAGMDHHWKAREAFWGACLRNDHIEDSWLVLGVNVVRAIASNRELQGSHARLTDGDANHSVLLMRIGGTIFAEWSHNGKLRAWAADWKNAPSLFRSTYRRSELTTRCMQFPPPRHRPELGTTETNGLTHHAGVWQGRVAELLRRREGFQLQAREWGGE